MAATQVPTKTSSYRTGTPVRNRPIPRRIPRRAIESSPVLSYLAGREPDDPEQWSYWWERRLAR